MAVAVVRVSYYGASASEPAGANAETGITFSLSDAQAPASGTAPVSIPTATGTNYSYIMLLALEVTTISSAPVTSLSNRTIRYASGVTAGSQIFWANQPTYRQPAAGNKPANAGTAGPATPTPAGASAPGSYAAITTSAQQWSATGVSSGATGRNGNFVEIVYGVDNTYAGGGGQEVLPNLTITYDES